MKFGIFLNIPWWFDMMFVSEKWDSTFETRDFAMKHGEALRICPGMEHNWVLN